MCQIVGVHVFGKLSGFEFYVSENSFRLYFGSFILVPVLVLEFPVQYPTFIIANTGFRLSHNCMVALHKPNLSKANEISSNYGIT